MFSSTNKFHTDAQVLLLENVARYDTSFPFTEVINRRSAQYAHDVPREKKPYMFIPYAARRLLT